MKDKPKLYETILFIPQLVNREFTCTLCHKTLEPNDILNRNAWNNGWCIHQRCVLSILEEKQKPEKHLKYTHSPAPKLIIPSPAMKELTEEYLIPALMDKVHEAIDKHINELHSAEEKK